MLWYSTIEKARMYYYKGEFKKALPLFRDLYKKYSDPVSGVYIERVGHLIKNPPAGGWDGVYHATSK